MTPEPRRIRTAGTWRETEEGLLYAAVAKSGDEVLARADVTLVAADLAADGDGRQILPEVTRREIEAEIEEVVRQQGVRVLDRRERAG